MMHWRAPLALGRVHAQFVVAAAVALLASFSVLGSSSAGAAETSSLQASADTYLRSGATNTNEGGSSFLQVRASGDNRALVQFDQASLHSLVGSGTLVSASLTFTIAQNGDNWGASGRTISVYRLTSPWTEGNGFDGQGAPPRRGSGPGATWSCASDAQITNQAKDCSGATEWEMGKPSQPQLHPWVEPATASTLITNGQSGSVSFDVTADVQEFLAGSATNDGWIVKKDLEGQPGQIQLASRETGNGPRLMLQINRGPTAPANLAPPIVSGTTDDASALSAATGTWTADPAPSFTYQWQRCSAYSQAVAADGPVGWWRMSEPTGAVVVDASPYANDGVYPPGITHGTPSAVSTPVAGDTDASTGFPGTGNATVPTSDTLDGLGGDLSLELWFKPSAAQTAVPLLAKQVGDGSTAGGLPALQFGLVLENQTTISFRMRLQEQQYDNDGTEFAPGPIRDVSLTAPVPLVADAWVHVVATHTTDDGTGSGGGGLMRLYVNGRLAASRAESGDIPSYPSQPLRIGGMPEITTYFSGQLDEAAVYLFPLDADQVYAHYTAKGGGCVDVADATDPTFALSDEDRGSRLRVRITATNTVGSATATSALTNTVTTAPPPNEDPATETPTYVAGPMPDTPDPDPVAPLSLLRHARYSLLQLTPLAATQTVTWSSTASSFKFGNGDGIWEISKNCRDWTNSAGRHAVGPGYIFRAKGYVTGFDSGPTQTYVDDTVAVAPGFEKFGLMNAVYGGLGSFGFHYARGPINGTPAGDDPTITTDDGQTAFPGRSPQKVIEGRQCASTNDGYGVYERNWVGPRRIGPGRVDFEMTVWLKDAYGNTGAGPGGNALVRVRYRYSFLRDQVKSWNSVRIYATANATGVPFVKEPKFAAVVNGGHYKRLAVLQNDRYITGTMKGEPQSPANPLDTTHSAWNQRTRVQWDLAVSAPKPTPTGQLPSPPEDGCSQTDPCFTATAKAMPVDIQGDVKIGNPAAFWEGKKLGLDWWAARPAHQSTETNPISAYPIDTLGDGVVSSCGLIPTKGIITGNDTVRRWEIGGFKSAGSGLDNQTPYDRSFVFFNGWEGGRGPEDCEPLQIAMAHEPGAPFEAYGTYLEYSFRRPCWCQ